MPDAPPSTLGPEPSALAFYDSLPAALRVLLVAWAVGRGGGGGGGGEGDERALLVARVVAAVVLGEQRCADVARAAGISPELCRKWSLQGADAVRRALELAGLDRAKLAALIAEEALGNGQEATGRTNEH
jgi:hypothetical protein